MKPEFDRLVSDVDELKRFAPDVEIPNGQNPVVETEELLANLAEERPITLVPGKIEFGKNRKTKGDRTPAAIFPSAMFIIPPNPLKPDFTPLKDTEEEIELPSWDLRYTLASAQVRKRRDRFSGASRLTRGRFFPPAYFLMFPMPLPCDGNKSGVDIMSSAHPLGHAVQFYLTQYFIYFAQSDTQAQDAAKGLTDYASYGPDSILVTPDHNFKDPEPSALERYARFEKAPHVWGDLTRASLLFVREMGPAHFRGKYKEHSSVGRFNYWPDTGEEYKKSDYAYVMSPICGDPSDEQNAWRVFSSRPLKKAWLKYAITNASMFFDFLASGKLFDVVRRTELLENHFELEQLIWVRVNNPDQDFILIGGEKEDFVAGMLLTPKVAFVFTVTKGREYDMFDKNWVLHRVIKEPDDIRQELREKWERCNGYGEVMTKEGPITVELNYPAGPRLRLRLFYMGSPLHSLFCGQMLRFTAKPIEDSPMGYPTAAAGPRSRWSRALAGDHCSIHYEFKDYNHFEVHASNEFHSWVRQNYDDEHIRRFIINESMGIVADPNGGHGHGPRLNSGEVPTSDFAQKKGTSHMIEAKALHMNQGDDKEKKRSLDEHWYYFATGVFAYMNRALRAAGKRTLPELGFSSEHGDASSEADPTQLQLPTIQIRGRDGKLHECGSVVGLCSDDQASATVSDTPEVGFDEMDAAWLNEKHVAEAHAERCEAESGRTMSMFGSVFEEDGTVHDSESRFLSRLCMRYEKRTNSVLAAAALAALRHKFPVIRNAFYYLEYMLDKYHGFKMGSPDSWDRALENMAYVARGNERAAIAFMKANFDVENSPGDKLRFDLLLEALSMHDTEVEDTNFLSASAYAEGQSLASCVTPALLATGYLPGSDDHIEPELCEQIFSLFTSYLQKPLAHDAQLERYYDGGIYNI